jgi:anhydro-N-acetylmuramic acid kinase
VYHYEILNTGYIEYDSDFKGKLSRVHVLNTIDFIKFHKSFGSFIGTKINAFLSGKPKPDFISSHGHTIFHMPSEKLTFQIGDGAFIAAETKLPVVSDFRNLDTALNGQGAPLVPIGDKLLFPEYDYCLNLGGFANISYDLKDRRIAFDICPVNIILNWLSLEKGYEYDKDGELGKNGTVNKYLLNDLNAIPFYSIKHPKSLGREYIENFHQKIIDHCKISTNDKLRTYYLHVANQISKTIDPNKNSKILITGGGALNAFLINEIHCKLSKKNEVIIPEHALINFKEAIIFAFLGYLRIRNSHNVLKSVTGADMDHCGGSVIIL